jgi:hypothetical protein
MLAGTVVGRSLVHQIDLVPTRSQSAGTAESERFRCYPRWFRLFANPGLSGVRFDRPGELPTVTIAQVYRTSRTPPWPDEPGPG